MTIAITKRIKAVAALLVGAATAAAQQPFDLDVSYGTSIESIYVSDLEILQNGQILISGQLNFQWGDPFTPTLGARLNTDGSRDTGFPAFPWMGGRVTIWQDKFYCAVGQTVRRSFLNGTLDGSFQSLNSTPYFSSFQGGDYHVYPDGSVVITGSHTMNVPDSGWVGSHHMIWFNNDGTLDFTRRPRRGNGTISLIVPQPDGKFLLSGAATTWEGVPKPNIFRVHADGTLDTSFTCAMGWGEAASMTVLDDGRILVSGLFKTQFSSPDTLHFVRLMPNGELDPTFNNDLEVTRQPWLPPEWPGNPIYWGQFTIPEHTRLSDGRIVLHGSHLSVEGQERLGIAMLDADGNLLEEPFGNSACGRYYYEPNGFLYGSINGLLEAPDGYIYIWGAYKGYDDGTTNDPAQRFISRLYGLNVGVREQQQVHVEVFPNPSTGQFTIQLDRYTGAENLDVQDALGRHVLQQRITAASMVLDLSQQADGLYSLAVRSNGRTPVVQRVVIQH